MKSSPSILSQKEAVKKRIKTKSNITTTQPFTINIKQPNNETTTRNKENEKKQKNKNENEKEKKSKLHFEDEHWIHVQQEF